MKAARDCQGFKGNHPVALALTHMGVLATGLPNQKPMGDPITDFLISGLVRLMIPHALKWSVIILNFAMWAEVCR